jgi:hypothetical protein
MDGDSHLVDPSIDRNHSSAIHSHFPFQFTHRQGHAGCLSSYTMAPKAILTIHGAYLLFRHQQVVLFGPNRIQPLMPTN